MTNADGEFVFRALERGEYLVGINLVVPPQSKRGRGSGAYPATYYPGVVQRDEAEILHLEKGQQLAGVTVSLPSPLIEREIKGQVTLDGKPVAGASVALQQLDYNLYTDSTRSDAGGEFSLIGFEGYDYSLIATWVSGLTGYHGRAEVPSGSVQPIEIRLERRKR
jgi:hypothetical protein